MSVEAPIAEDVLEFLIKSIVEDPDRREHLHGG